MICREKRKEREYFYWVFTRLSGSIR